MGLSVEFEYPIQNKIATRISGEGHASHNEVVKYLLKKKQFYDSDFYEWKKHIEKK